MNGGPLELPCSKQSPPTVQAYPYCGSHPWGLSAPVTSLTSLSLHRHLVLMLDFRFSLPHAQIRPIASSLPTSCARHTSLNHHCICKEILPAAHEFTAQSLRGTARRQVNTLRLQTPTPMFLLRLIQRLALLSEFPCGLPMLLVISQLCCCFPSPTQRPMPGTLPVLQSSRSCLSVITLFGPISTDPFPDNCPYLSETTHVSPSPLPPIVSEPLIQACAWLP